MKDMKEESAQGQEERKSLWAAPQLLLKKHLRFSHQIIFSMMRPLIWPLCVWENQIGNLTSQLPRF